MLFKVIALCALIVCVLGDGKLNPQLDCAFHVTMQKTGSKMVQEKYGFKTADALILMTESYSPDSLPRKDYNLYRSDIKDGDDILFLGFGGNDTKHPKYCQDEYIEYESALKELAPLTETFEFVGDGEKAACPNASLTGCKKFCNANGECVIADSQERYVQLVDGTTVTYENIVHDREEFAGFNCTTDEPYDAPVNPCGNNKLNPQLGCAFHAIFRSNTTSRVTEKYGFKTDEDYILMTESYDPDKLPHKDYSLYRSDIKDGDDILFLGFGGNDTKHPKYCQEEYIEYESALYEIAQIATAFEYAGDGEKVPCPDASDTGCKKFCNSDGDCVIADSQERYVQLVDGTTVTYKNVVHHRKEFAGFNCTTDEAFDAPVNPCGNESSSSSSSDASTLKTSAVAFIAVIAFVVILL